MELVQSRIVTGDVEGLAAFYARLAGTPVALNEYYAEAPAGALPAGLPICRFTEYGEDQAARPEGRRLSVFSRGKGVHGVPPRRAASRC